MNQPLGLPRGSVRALLALFVVFVACWLMVLGETAPLAVSEALFTVLAYYFAARGLVQLSRTEREQLRAGRGNGNAERPLFLPLGTIRVIIIVSFVGVAVHLAVKTGFAGLLSATTLLLVMAFFAGQVVKHALRWLRRNRPQQGAGAFEHIKAAVGILVGLAFVALYVSGYHKAAPPRVHKLFLGVIIFYFGSR